MTAEVAVLNKSAVALAADSAITISMNDGGQKIYNSVNKLFSISRCHPVGIMIFSNAQFMELPWETIIKEYRQTLSRKPLPRLADYGASFIRFLSRYRPLFARDRQVRYVGMFAYSVFNYVKDSVALRAIKKELDVNGTVSEEVITAIFESAIRTVSRRLRSEKFMRGFNSKIRARILRIYRKEINGAANEVFQKIPLSRGGRAILTKIVGDAIVRDWQQDRFYSGVVIAGFGAKDEFPSVVPYYFHGIAANRLKYTASKTTKIDTTNRATIRPFAQGDEVVSFITGIHPDYRKEIAGYVKTILTRYPTEILDCLKELPQKKREQIKKKLQAIGNAEFGNFETGFKSYERQRYVHSMIQAVGFLPKDEVAAMAEALVNITSLKRRVSTDPETVGGPTDVAVISKGDGFIWIKRKQYFDSRLNPHFIAKYNIEKD